MGIIFNQEWLSLIVAKMYLMKNLTAVLLFLLLGFGQLMSAQEHPSKSTPVSEKKVMIVYGSDECHHCTDTKKYLKENNIDFVFFDIDKNQEALKEMLFKLKKANISTNNLSIPVIDKQGVIFTNNIPFEEFLKKLK
jgi:glutaredoxin